MNMNIKALTTLVESAEAIGYSLPTELLDAHRTYGRIRRLTVPEPTQATADTVAARLISAVAAGEDEPDLVALARILDASDVDRALAEKSRRILSEAIDQAAHAAALLSMDLTERIITDHLRPALEQIYDETREVADALQGYGLDPHALVTAPTKARNAYAKLPSLVTRWKGVNTARRHVNTVGNRTPQHDQTGLFATFAKPMTFFPHWSPPARVPLIPFPENDNERLLWMVGPEAQRAEPWLPTVAEQDAAWWKHFGEGQEMRAQAHRNGLAVGARIG